MESMQWIDAYMRFEPRMLALRYMLKGSTVACGVQQNAKAGHTS